MKYFICHFFFHSSDEIEPLYSYFFDEVDNDAADENSISYEDLNIEDDDPDQYQDIFTEW